jgi:hypothetical protein
MAGPSVRQTPDLSFTIVDLERALNRACEQNP